MVTIKLFMMVVILFLDTRGLARVQSAISKRCSKMTFKDLPAIRRHSKLINDPSNPPDCREAVLPNGIMPIYSSQVVTLPPVSNKEFLVSDNHTSVLITIHNVVGGMAGDSGDEKSILVLQEVLHILVAANDAISMVDDSVGEECVYHFLMVKLFEDEVMPVDEVNCT
jgi:hypothetical protein